MTRCRPLPIAVTRQQRVPLSVELLTPKDLVLVIYRLVHMLMVDLLGQLTYGPEALLRSPVRIHLVLTL